MEKSHFAGRFRPDVPFAGTSGSPNINTGVLSITRPPTGDDVRVSYHFWVTDASCVEPSIAHFQSKGFPDCHFVKFTSREQWTRSYRDAVLQIDSLPTAPPKSSPAAAPPLAAVDANVVDASRLR